MRLNIALSVFLILFCFPGVRAGESQKLDSLQHLLQGASQTDSIKYLLLIGEEYYSSEDYSTSLDYFFACLKHAEAIENIIGSADAANNIGRVHYDMENFEEALNYFNRALVYFERSEDETSQGGVLNNIALIYYELDSTDKAIEHYNRALEIKEKYDEKLDIATINHNLGLVYMNVRRYDQATVSLSSAREIFLELGYDKYAANTTNNIGRAYYRSGQYKTALEHFKNGLEEAKKQNSHFLMMDNYKYQSDCYNKMENYREALWYSNKYYNLKDSLLNIDKEKELAEIQARYENEIKEHENRVLKKENEAKAATIKMQYIVGVGIFITALLCGVMAIIYYRGNQAKKKANDLLRNQKVEIEQKNDSLSKLNNEISKQNEAIKSQKKELEELNAIKDRLFSIISHEFRSPLNSLKGTLALFKSGIISKEEIELISKELNDKINNTSIFLENLLNWARSQMHGINPKPVYIDLSKVAYDTIELLKPIADKKTVYLENKISSNHIAYADPNMMSLVFKNLISNAIKFSLKGGAIEIDSEKNGKLHTVSVKDSGIGISSENIKLLFQVQTITTRGTANERGSGLGLFIARNFIESNGGKIWVESEEGKGSAFKFTVPADN